jgi:PAS domain S-box-containing protein
MRDARRALWRALALAALLVAGLAAPAAGAPVAQGGALDLSAWNFERDGIASLDGEWEFFPGQLLAPGQQAAAAPQLLRVPGPWNAALDGGRGFATYRLRVACPPGGVPSLGLALPFQHSAMALYVNGQLLARQGVPGATPGEEKPALATQAVALGERGCPLEFVAQVSNFQLFRGGLMRSIQLGTTKQLAERREAALTRSLLAIGAVLVVSFLSLIFFAWRRQDRIPLFFGVYCLSFAISLGLAGERPLQPLVAGLDFAGQFRLLLTVWFFGLSMFPLFLRALYRSEIGPWPVRAIVAFSLAGVLLALLTPIQVFSYSAPVLQAGSVVIALYMTFVLVRAFWLGQRGAGILLVGLAVLVAAVAHDVIFFQHLLSSSMLPFGVVGIVLAPAILLAQRFARALAAEEARVIEQRGRTDMLMRATKAGLLDWDAFNNVVGYTERYKEMFGYPADARAEALPSFRDMLHPEEREHVFGLFLQQLRDRTVRDAVRQYQPLEYRMRRADGEYIWVHAEGIGVCGTDGRTLRFVCSFIDISASKRHEIEMSNRIKFINDLFDSVPLGLALRDPEGRYLFVNRTWERYIGLKRESVIGTSLGDVKDPAAESTLALDREALALGPGATTTARDYDYNGRRYMQTRTVMVDSEGQRIGVLVASLDITDKYATEQALAMERERLRLLVRSTKAGFGDWDAVRDVVTYTDRFKEMLGYAADADTSAWPSIFEMMHPEDRERARDQFRAMIRRKSRPGEQEPGAPMSYRLRRRDGSCIWIHADGIAQVDDEGRTRRFITSYLDVTAFHEQEDALRASNEQIAEQAAQLERQNEALKENVRLREEVERIGRHDIKTPLNSIVAVPRLLREERKLGPEADELLGIVERAGYRILSMVNLSLDLYKMEQGSYLFRPDAVDLADLVNKVATDVGMHAASKQVRLKVDVGAAPYAWAEELLCYSMLANLLKNAVEASPEGSVVTVGAGAADGGMLLMRIHNQGVVPEAIRDGFFQKYATLGKASGTGLGTYSARLMARVQDGDIEMATSPALGTVLTIRLRAAPAGAVPATVRHAAGRQGIEPLRVAALPPMRVLLVDDDEYNLLIVRRFLPTPPFTVDTAINGRVALAAAELQWPDVIFMDLDMPVMGGLQAVLELRALERATLARRCTMVALSSHEDEETRQRSLAAGFDKYLVKPVTRDAIHETLLELTTLIGTAAAAPQPQAPEPAPGKDDPVVLDPEIEPILADFVHSRRGLIAGMERAMQGGDRGEVRRLAHQLAGSFGLYGFRWASDQSRAVERDFSQIDAEHLSRVAGELHAHLDTVEIRFSET